MRMSTSLLILLLFLTACGGSGGGPATTTAPPNSTVVPTPVHDIQGAGANSPLAGSTVSVTAIVTGDFQDNDTDNFSNLSGFYVQELVADADPNTSEGLFIFDGDSPAVNVNVGDRVVVNGTVAESFGETQVTATRVEVTGVGLIQATDINFPVANLVANNDGVLIADLEAYEGMLVRFPQQLTVNELYDLGRFGQILLSQQGRNYTYTNQNKPDIVGNTAHLEQNAAHNLLLDDGRRSSNDDVVRYLHSGTGADYFIRSGDAINGLTGNLRFSRGSGGSGVATYRLMPTIEPQLESLNPRPGPPSIGGALRVASVNVLNYFPTIDTGQSECGPSGGGSCRGADSQAELDRQFSKMITALSLVDADIIALIEIENNDTESLARIVTGLNDKLGAASYAYVNTGTIGTDSIKTGFLYRSTTIGLQGAHAVLDSRVDARFIDTKNRPALAQSFVRLSNGAVLTLAVNHLKSKGSNCDSGGDPDLGDGQGNCNRTRTDAAAALADWLAGDPTASGDADFLIVGDLNAHIAEDPLSALKNAGYVNLVEDVEGGDAYSYAFSGQFGALDHALASPSLVPQVIATMEWHINADEPPLLDYNLEFGRDASLFDADSPYRASDHDPIIVGIELSN